jgi:outer membrane receptor protein involved in Fe transport
MLIALALAAAAQDQVEVVVTGTGLPAPPGDAAYDVVVIDRERLTNVSSGRLEDALRDVAGLAQFRRADSRSANPTSQGITLRGLGGNASSRALLILDGVPQTDPFGGWVAFPAYQPDRLASARVTRGGGSGYAGPGALAGTVELTSVTPSSLGPFSAQALYGSRNSAEASAVGAAPLGAGFAMLAGSYARGEGFVPIVRESRGPVDRPAPYEQASVAARAVVGLGGATELQANLLVFTDRRDRGTAFTAIRSDGADASVRLVGRGRWGWSALAYLQTRGFASGFAMINAARTTVNPTLDQYNVPATGLGARMELSPPLGDRLTLRIGGDARRVSGRTQELFTYVAGLPTRRREAGGVNTTVGAFADLSLEAGDLTLSGGARVDRWTIANGALVERALAGGAALTDARFASRSGWEPTGRVGAALRVGSGATVRTAAYRGWRLPTLNELHRPFRVGADATAAEPGLAPETVDGAELGFDLRPGRGVTLRLTGYVNRLDAAIANVGVGAGPGIFPGVGFVAAGGVFRRRANLDAIEAKGVEADLSWIAGDWRLGASYALTNATVRGSGTAAALDGLAPAQAPLHQASATLGWRQLGVTARYLGSQFEDDANSRALADAFTLDAVVRLPLTSSLDVFGRAENIADARVETAISGPGVIERASPRTLWIGLAYRASASNSAR